MYVYRAHIRIYYIRRAVLRRPTSSSRSLSQSFSAFLASLLLCFFASTLTAPPPALPGVARLCSAFTLWERCSSPPPFVVRRVERKKERKSFASLRTQHVTVSPQPEPSFFPSSQSKRLSEKRNLLLSFSLAPKSWAKRCYVPMERIWGK